MKRGNQGEYVISFFKLLKVDLQKDFSEWFNSVFPF
jgi:hypothetical protein